VHKIDNIIYIVYEDMEADLQAVSRAGILQDIHIVYVMYQILCLLKYAHSANIIFTSLRTERFGVMADCTVKLTGFNDAFIQGQVKEDPVRKAIINQWFRAPEQLLQVDKSDQTTAVDMWALGCILGNLLHKSNPPFLGNSSMNQMERILQFVGQPSEGDLRDTSSSANAKLIAGWNEPKDKRDFKDLYPNASEEALDLLKQLFEFNPKKRITAEDALNHPFVAAFRGSMSEIDCPFKATLGYYPEKLLDSEYRSEMLQAFMDQFWKKVYEPISNTKILTHNIARSSEALTLLPIEVWTLIFSELTYPNYGSCERIAKDIFDHYFRPKATQ
jgi:mitogen-activated protein kinase 15